MSITFKNSPVYVGTDFVFAKTATISERAEFARVDELGYSSVRTILSSRPRGDVSIDGYLTDSALGIIELTGISPFQVRIGPLECTGYLEDFSIKIAPLTLVECSMKAVFFSEMSRNASITPAATLDAEDISHGAFSTANINNLVSINLSFSQSVTPYFAIGTNTIIGMDFNGGQIKCDIDGTGLQKVLDLDCDSSSDLVLNLKNVCNTELGDLTVEGLKVTESSLTIQADDVVGKMSLIRYF